MTYPLLPIEAFGRQLIESGDLDPLYIGLHRLDMGSLHLNRFLLAYSCFYDAGTACWATDSGTPDEFWEVLLQAAINSPESPTPFGGRWPRGHERRHARGKGGVAMIEGLMERYPHDPERFIVSCATGGIPVGQVTGVASCREVIRRVRTHFNFGPWIGFKIADLIDRVVGVPVDFGETDILMFDGPRRAAELVPNHTLGFPVDSEGCDRVSAVLYELRYRYRDLKAPPRYERPVGFAECETVLCKWKSHLSGHYPPLNDIHEIRAGLEKFVAFSSTAARLLAVFPDGSVGQ